MERNISSSGKNLNRFIELQGNRFGMTVDTQQGDHQLGKSTKALTDQGHPIETSHSSHSSSALGIPHISYCICLILMMAVKVTIFIKTHQQ